MADIVTEFQGTRADFRAVPVIDLSSFRVGQQIAETVTALGRAARDVGFFYVRGHGVPHQTIARAVAASRAFFALPLEVKNRYPISATYPHQRGYSPVFGEDLGMDEAPDLKESFDLGLNLPTDDPDVLAGRPFYAPNVWPLEVPDFQSAMVAYHDATLALARTIGEAIALSLDLPRGYFTARMKKPIANLRLLHYPPHTKGHGQTTIGAGAHSDYGFITVLLQDRTGGLQVCNPAGEWIDAPPIDGTFVVNIGEMLSMWTNDLFIATRHRVINAGGQDRFSIPLFVDMDHDTRVECVPSCLAPGDQPRYSAVNAGAYISKRLDETFPFRRQAS